MFIVLLLGLSSTLIVLLFLLTRSVIVARDRVQLSQYRSKSQGLVDLLNYGSVIADGVILNKNGSLMAAWLFEGEDQESATNGERNHSIAMVNDALRRLDGGWTLHVDVVRQPSSSVSDAPSFFPDTISAEIERRRNAFFQAKKEVFDSVQLLTVTWLPPAVSKTRLSELMYDTPKSEKKEKNRDFGNKLLTQFQTECQNLENRLSTVFKLSRLKAKARENEGGEVEYFDDFLQFLHYAVTGKNHPIRLPSMPIFLDSLIGGAELRVGTRPKLGDQYIQCVAIDGFPSESHPNILAALAELPLTYRWSTRFIMLDHHVAASQLKKYRNHWKQRTRGFMDQVMGNQTGAVNQDALMMMEDAEAAQAEHSANEALVGFYTSVIVLTNSDPEVLALGVRQIQRLVQRLGFSSRLETVNTVEAYLGSLPGHTHQNVRRPLMDTLNLGCLLPTSSVWSGDKVAPCPFYPPKSPPLMQVVTTGHTPFYLNLHVGDLGHTLMFGPTGAGKSTHLAILAAQLRRYQDMSIFVFDKGLSMYSLCKAMGGNHFTIAGDESLNFCPLQHLETPADKAWALDWLTSLLALVDFQVTPGQVRMLTEALESLSHEAEFRTLTDFCGALQDKALREALHAYTSEGLMGFLLDAPDDGINLSDFTVFELEHLMELGDRFALPVLLYLFHQIERRLQEQEGKPSAIIIDEAWLMLSHPVFREKIRLWLKVLRKANCVVILATQSLSDAARSGILDVLIESAATKIFLPNPNAREEEATSLYKRMQLNERQIDILATAVPKQQYYCVSTKGRRLYSLALDDYALAFVGASDKASIARIKQLESLHGADWPTHWLQERGVINERKAA